MGQSVYDENHPWNFALQINNAAGTGPTNVLASARDGQRIDHLWVCSSDTVDREIQLLIGPAGLTIRTVGSVTLPAGTGFGVLPAIDLLDKIMPGSGGLLLQFQDAVQVALAVAVTSGKLVVCYAVGGYI